MPLAACIFDMDGVLLDSEPFWRRAEVEVFGTVGLDLTEEDCVETMGVRIDEVVAYRFAQRPWAGPSREAVAERIVDRVVALVRERACPLPGVRDALAFLAERRVPLALASSSSRRLIDAVLRALDLDGTFAVVHSAETEEFGKPHPAVYLTTADRLRVAPALCLAVEDSVNGVLSARAAGMRVVAIPEAAVAGDPRFAVADLVLSSLEGFPAAWEALAGDPRPFSP